jgi:hypothetical protein
MLVTIGLFFLCNQLIYNHPLGIHAIQVVEDSSLTQKLKDAWKSFQELGLTFLNYFPITLFLVFYLILSFFKKREIKFNLTLILVYLICLFFILGVSLIVPPGTAGLIPGGKQWGARFLLILIPIVTLVAIKELIYLKESVRPILGYVGISIISLLLIVGIHKNTYAATIYLQENHQGILPAIEFIEKNPNDVIAISHQFVAQAIEASVSRDKFFFLVENKKSLSKLSAALLRQKQQNFLYVCYPFRPCPLPEEISENLKIIQKDRRFTIKFLNLGKLGKYPIYEVAIAQN